MKFCGSEVKTNFHSSVIAILSMPAEKALEHMGT
jgi:hypothetical protein